VAFYVDKNEVTQLPRKPAKPCSYPGCPKLTYGRYCEKQQKEIDQSYNKNCRPYSYLYNSSRWRRLRKQFLHKHPLCEECKRKGIVNAATVVDHIKPHQGDEGCSGMRATGRVYAKAVMIENC
jgi:5-methylcytosine-specific restriction protein A